MSCVPVPSILLINGGYWSRSSTGTLLSTIDSLHRSLESGSGSFFPDLTKAFDEVPHVPLLKDLPIWILIPP